MLTVAGLSKTFGGRQLFYDVSPAERRKRAIEMGAEIAKEYEDLGIDRICMMLLGQESIRDVILFPQLKPK